MDKRPYIVYNREGRAVMETTVACRYNKKTEQSLLENGYSIRIDGKKLTKKEINDR